MAVKKKTAKKKVSKKKVAAKKAIVKRVPAISKKQTKTQIIQAISEETNLTKKEVASVFSSMEELIERHMKKRGSGEFTIPNTGVKIRRVKRPARKARMGRNPATGEAVKIAAKPAQNIIRISALKALKDTLL